MIRVLLDTDHMSLHERGHLPLRARLAAFPSEEVATSIVTVEEMIRGRLALPRHRRRERPAWEEHLRMIQIGRQQARPEVSNGLFLLPCQGEKILLRAAAVATQELGHHRKMLMHGFEHTQHQVIVDLILERTPHGLCGRGYLVRRGAREYTMVQLA